MGAIRTLRMKRILLGLLPWMVAVCGAQGALRPAEVSLTHLGSAPAWRLGDVCYVNPSAFIGWKWPYSFVGNEATIQAEGRTVRVMGKSIETRFLVPLNEVLDQLGAAYAWQADRDVFGATGSIRSVKVQGGAIQVDATLSVKPEVSWLENPPRLVIDLKGAKLAENANTELDPGARVGQFGPSTVRIVIEGVEKPLAPTFEPTRAFQWSLSAPPALDAKPIATPPSTPPVLATTIALKGAELVADTDAGATLRFTATAPLPAAPKIRRIDPLTLEIDLAKVGAGDAVAMPKSNAVTELTATGTATGSTLRLVTSRPMGLKFSSVGDKFVIDLIKPRVGDGKLAGKIVVVDPGHGKHDPGAKAPDKSVFEKNLTLAIATLVTQELTAQGATVIQTRTDDTFVELKERAEIANRNGADFFVSCHINSNRVSNTTSGTITFHHGGSVTGQLLAECIQTEIGKIDGMPSIGVWSDTRIYSTGFAVLRYSTMPAVLLELGFINHERDRKRMQERSYQEAVAKAVVKGLRVYLGDVKP